MIIDTPQGQVAVITVTEETFQMMIESLPERQKTLLARAEREKEGMEKWIEGNINQLQEEAENAKSELLVFKAEVVALNAHINELGGVIAGMREIPRSGQEVE